MKGLPLSLRKSLALLLRLTVIYGVECDENGPRAIIQVCTHCCILYSNRYIFRDYMDLYFTFYLYILGQPTDTGKSMAKKSGVPVEICTIRVTMSRSERGVETIDI